MRIALVTLVGTLVLTASGGTGAWADDNGKDNEGGRGRPHIQAPQQTGARLSGPGY